VQIRKNGRFLVAIWDVEFTALVDPEYAVETCPVEIKEPCSLRNGMFARIVDAANTIVVTWAIIYDVVSDISPNLLWRVSNGAITLN
jgi:hypothetical protein